MSNSWKTNGENYVGYSPKTHNPSTTNNNRVIIEGWLKKRSSKGLMWVDRYFKLVGTGLYQYKQKEEGWVEKSHKAFDISNTTLSTRDDYHGAKFCFSIKGIAARTGKKGQKSDGYIFKTKNSIELNQWLEALSTASSHDPNKKKRFVYKSDKDQEEDWDSLVVKQQQYNSGLSSIDILMNGNQKQFSTANKLNNSKDNIGNELYKPSEELYKPDPSLFEVKTQSEPLFTQINPTPYANNYLQQQQQQQQQQQLQQQQLLQQQLLQQQQQQQLLQQQQLQQQQQQQQQQQPNLQTQQLQQQILQLQLQLQQQQQQSPPLQQQQYGLNFNPQQPNYQQQQLLQQQQQQQYGLNYSSPQLQHSGSYPNLNLPQVPQHNIGFQNSPQMNHYQYN